MHLGGNGFYWRIALSAVGQERSSFVAPRAAREPGWLSPASTTTPGAAGEEIDRHDLELGSPRHSLVVATAGDLGPEMLMTKEDILFTAPCDPADPDVRADVVFFETEGGGAVFSTGSIAWAGSLGERSYDNDVARLTRNVLMRFCDAQPFAAPDQP